MLQIVVFLILLPRLLKLFDALYQGRVVGRMRVFVTRHVALVSVVLAPAGFVATAGSGLMWDDHPMIFLHQVVRKGMPLTKSRHRHEHTPSVANHRAFGKAWLFNKFWSWWKLKFIAASVIISV